MRIARRVPFFRVDAVQDADEIVAPRAQDSVEAEPELRRLDLFGVPPADRRDDPRVGDAALHEADTSPVFQTIDGELIPAEIERRQ